MTFKPEISEGLSLKRDYSSACTSYESDSPSSPGKTTRKPMRKRAKTQEEKEERAQERIMRNRAAAQVSRERKREHMVALEHENEALKQQVRSLANDNASLRSNVSSLTQRLEAMEKMMALFAAPDAKSTPNSSSSSIESQPSSFGTQIQHNSYCPAPPGTVRPQDILSNPSSPLLESLDSRNPAVIANDPQRRISTRPPWNLSSRSPIYRQTVSILSFWTTILRMTTSRAFTNHMSISLLMHCAAFPKGSLPRALDHWRFTATGQDAQAGHPLANQSLLIETDDIWSIDCFGPEQLGMNEKRNTR